MKLLFWPLFLFALIQRLFFRDQENYWCVKLAEILLGLVGETRAEMAEVLVPHHVVRLRL